MASNQPRVLLLHGLWMHAPAMRWFATRLSSHGFDARAIGYYSVMEDTDHAVARIAAALRAAPGTHAVAHSLGGLLALRAAELAGAPLGRIVCLGTPLAGSAAADGVASRIPAGGRFIGQHLSLLLEGAGALPADVEVGMVAGCRRRGLGGVVARFDCEHDGTVSIAETRIDGLADHVIVDASHSGLIFSDAALEQAAHFLGHGRFLHEDAGRPPGIA